LLSSLSMNFLGPLHRYTFGIGWKDSNYCAHIDHKDSFVITKKRKRKRNSSAINRVAPFHLVQHLVQFPYGGRLCGNHINQIYSSIKTRESTADELNAFSGIHSYEVKVDKSRELDNTNMLLISLDQSPLKSQAKIRLEEQTPGAVRRLAAKLHQVVSVAGNLSR
jgi:hypothetical protein